LRGVEVSKTTHGRVFDEEGTLAIISLFNNKVDFVQKPYVEVLVDAALSLNESENFTEKYKAFYGIGIGELNNTEIIPPLFDEYIPGKWKLVVMIPNETVIQINETYDDYYTVTKNITIIFYYNVTYGYISGEPKWVYKQLIPVPEERIGKLILYIG
jgi:hypothetical protein